MAKKNDQVALEQATPMGEGDMPTPVEIVADAIKESQKPSSVYRKLMAVQVELNAPKNQYNQFGKYNYRSTEDILEGVKPLLKLYGAAITITDDIEFIEGRFYIKATATFVDCETGVSISNTAFAREEDSKKGMDASQVTGATSSYARKYALNGLLLCDDNKDADTNENKVETDAREKKRQSTMTDDQKNNEMVKNASTTKITAVEAATLKSLMERKGVKGDNYGTTPIADLTGELYTKALAQLNKMPDVTQKMEEVHEELPFE